jgi:Putative capsular polysaccharide synthesis protein
MLKSIVRTLATQNYYASRALFLRHLKQEHMRYPETPVLIFTMGKVGSQTVQASLRARESELGRPIYDTHFLADKRGFTREKDNKEYFRTELHHRTLRSWHTQFQRSQLKSDRKRGRRWKVITLVRRPVSRSISEFFENLKVEKGNSGAFVRVKSRFQGYEMPTQGNFDIRMGLDEVNKLFPYFFDWYESHGREHERFFQEELEPTVGIDVLKEPFSKSQGYRIYHGEAADLLLVRLESLDDCAREAFKEFLNVSDFVLINKNVGAKKDYAGLYEQFVRSIKFPKTKLGQVYDSKYVKRFYTREETEKFTNYWSRDYRA